MNNESKHNIPIEQLSKYFAKELPKAEIEELEAWRDASIENQKEFDAFSKLWNLTGNEYSHEEIDVIAEWNKLEKEITPRGRVISFKRIIQVAAVVLVFFGLTYLFVSQSQKVSTKTMLAQVDTINLPDGSVVTLNSNSKLTYLKTFGEKERRVKLKGEAFFNVASNKELPFVIEAQGASIKVIGTQFNVKAYKIQEEVKVTVVEGTVELYESAAPKKQTILNAGETGVYHKKKKAIEKHPKVNKNDISWKTFEMTFENATLIEVAQVIEEVYHVQIEVTPKVAGCTVSVDFNQKNLAGVLKVLKSTLDLEIHKNNQTIIIDGEGC